MSRAIRRHHLARLKANRANHYGGYDKNDPRVRGILANTATPCSCPKCGNSRRWWGSLTMQEMRYIQRLKEEE